MGIASLGGHACSDWAELKPITFNEIYLQWASEAKKGQIFCLAFLGPPYPE
jgi:hypothetical protein